MKKLILFSLLCFAQFAFGQTKDLVKVAGTKCSIIPPDDFVVSKNFSGFQHNESGSSIIISELGAPYQTIVDGLTPSALKTRGMEFVSKKIVDFHNLKATVIDVTQPANGMLYLKRILIFGTDKYTVMVNGIYPEISKNMEKAIETSLFSTIYNSSQDEDLLGAVNFTINTEKTAFKPVKHFAASLIYSTSNEFPSENPTFIVSNSISKTFPGNIKKYAEYRLKQLPNGNQNTVKEINDIAIDNLEGCEIIADGKTTENMPELIYQVMLFNDKGDYYIMVGKAKKDFQKNLEIFKQLAKTFKRK